jgi:hypothetical protein
VDSCGPRHSPEKRKVCASTWPSPPLLTRVDILSAYCRTGPLTAPITSPRPAKRLARPPLTLVAHATRSKGPLCTFAMHHAVNDASSEAVHDAYA